MARQPNSFGGGAQTNINGLTFERNMDLLTVIDALPNFHTVNNKIYLKNILVAEHFSKYGSVSYTHLTLPTSDLV